MTRRVHEFPLTNLAILLIDSFFGQRKKMKPNGKKESLKKKFRHIDHVSKENFIDSTLIVKMYGRGYTRENGSALISPRMSGLSYLV